MCDISTEEQLLEIARKAAETGEPLKFEYKKHIGFLIRHLNVFPSPYNTLETSRNTIFLFAISSLDLLGELDNLLTPTRREAFINWIYDLQLTNGVVCGFRGSHSCEGSQYDEANLAQTYSALLSLAILGDDFKRVNREAILKTLKSSQRENGCFWSQGENSESDMRFVFCAVAICKILGAEKEDVIDWNKLATFLKKSLNIDGGLGQAPEDESHGGSTFCAIASLALSNRLWTEEVLTRRDIDRLIRWAIQKQEIGFHGRAHKPDDSCYSFWIGATLKILNAYHLISPAHLREFLMISQHPHIGGFCKYPEPGGYSDILHTYFSIAALSLLGEPGLNPVHPALNVSMRAADHIARLNFQ
ncbi:hypothetical protein CAEBREN_32678 [Caenorhabditis brenneri]|uniref:Geranylgeranyl transferase type-1 subunit beta n=1 Tax=Caenorhabditis brenneri TaxID=135651 RepID=G0MZA9_CAEBE|nr:hypothetical protein CAEBREN_06138 [Caenorhabditis brenneri]EGT55419.1 hypothetical protein CAEBREN_32678 [Caenorhabditis brenneri]